MQNLRRISYLALAFGLAVTGLAEGLLMQKAYAFPVGGQVQLRSVRMSSNAASATATYLVSFRPATAHTVTGIVLDFCNSASTPLIGDSTCNAPTGFSVGTPTVSSTPGESGLTDLGGTWTPVSANSGRTLKMTPSAGVVVNTSTTYAFNISTITNPSTVGTFYARLITYVGGTGGGTDYANYAPGTEGSTSATDYGGFALSTANTISITAKVPETMTFCVSGADPTANCGGTTAPVLTLGHGANNTLDSSAVDTAIAYTQLSTNASGGAIIRMKNNAASGGLNFGSNAIAPTGDAVATITAGTAAFGMRTADGSGGTGTITADTNYSSATQYGMDAVTTGADATSVLTTYGDPVASAAAPVNNVENTLTFAATASNTTPAGIYTATITLVATGSF